MPHTTHTQYATKNKRKIACARRGKIAPFARAGRLRADNVQIIRPRVAPTRVYFYDAHYGILALASYLKLHLSGYIQHFHHHKLKNLTRSAKTVIELRQLH